ncbi:MAG: FAD:protein FMN transferase [Saprospiraceae bacterium]|nr:FAD:protein FMN transferase [Saprospiraceae bacterium]MCB9320050.1 FAD:protein FMN transferase [Lewinellaceae bacterium]
MRNFIWLLLLSASACRQTMPDVLTRLQGETMGTYYQITLYGPSPDSVLIRGLDSVLHDVNYSMSTYMETSIISRFNRADTLFLLPADSIDLPAYHHFLVNLEAAKTVTAASGGYFDPSAMPVIRYWGFGGGRKHPSEVDTNEIHRLLKLKGIDKIHQIEREGSQYLHKPPGLELDFSALAKGYGVDVVHAYLQHMNYSNHLVDIGGEARTSGKKADQAPWVLGINVPDDKAGLEETVVQFVLQDRAVATSGNYRNFYELNGQRIVHTTNPLTGMNFPSDLLSATVVMDDCMHADAWATAFMSMGREKGMEILAQHPDWPVSLIFSDSSGAMQLYHTEPFKAMMQ